ncbi:MAG: HPr kinase/phosphorylase [Sphingobium sp.]
MSGAQTRDETDAAFAGPIHATSVAIGGQAVLLRGPSGSGKSDLALRLIDRGATLVSDDYTHVRWAGNGILASAMPNIAGQIEVRGLGIVDMPHIESAPVALIIVLTAEDEDPPERHPLALATALLCGNRLPMLNQRAFEASAPIKVELALRQLTGIIFPAGTT